MRAELFLWVSPVKDCREWSAYATPHCSGDKRRGLRGGAVGGGVGIFRDNNTVPAAGAIFNGGIEAVVGGATADDELLNVVFVSTCASEV